MKREEIEINSIQPITPLPDGYTQVNYLRAYNSIANRVPYINTNFIATNNTKIRIVFLYELDYGWVFGARSLTTPYKDFFGLTYGSGYIYQGSYCAFPQFGNVTGCETPQSKTDYVNVVIEHVMDKTGAFSNGVQINNIAFNNDTWTGTYPIFIFNLDNNGNPHNGLNGKVYECQIWDNGILQRDYVPALRISDNKPGMWDLCGSTCPLTNSPFYVRAGGSSEFTYA